MNKAELVAKVAERAELTKEQADKALNSFIAVTTTALNAVVHRDYTSNASV